MDTILLSKFDVTERQLLQAINMFFREEDTVSIHTLSEAAIQILRDIGADFGVKSMIRDNDIIRDDKKKEWQNVLSRSKNFFKHADRDKNEKHEFTPEFNDFSLLEGIDLHGSIKKLWMPETIIFQSWFGVAHPDLVKENSDLHAMLNTAKAGGRLPDPSNKEFMYSAINMIKHGDLITGKVSMKYGL